jgi:hypothetical protein
VGETPFSCRVLASGKVACVERRSNCCMEAAMQHYAQTQVMISTLLITRRHCRWWAHSVNFVQITTSSIMQPSDTTFVRGRLFRPRPHLTCRQDEQQIGDRLSRGWCRRRGLLQVSSTCETVWNGWENCTTGFRPRTAYSWHDSSGTVKIYSDKQPGSLHTF